MAQEMIQRGMGKHISRRHAARLLKKGAFNRTGSALGSHQYPIRNGRRSFYGRHGEFSTNRHEGQELTMLSLHLLQASLVSIQTLLLQQLLADPAWMNTMAREDLRALTPLIYANVNPYGTIHLDLAERLEIERAG